MGCLNENFDSYSNGNLTGNGSWSGNATWQVESSVVQAGTHAATVNSNSSLLISNTAISASSGIQSFYVRSDNVTSTSAVIISFVEGSTERFAMLARGSDSTYRLRGTSDVTIGTVAANTWYQVEIQFDGVGQQIRARINGGTWTSYMAAESNWTTINKITLSSGNQAVNWYWDTFTNNTPVTSSGFLMFM